MRFLRACAVALITALVGMFLAVFASDYLTKLYHVSDMEGQRGMTVILLFAPLGIIVGFVVGIVVALCARGPGFIGFVKTQGLVDSSYDCACDCRFGPLLGRCGQTAKNRRQ